MTPIADTDRPCLLRGVRLHRDPVRGALMLLAPEKAVQLDAVGEAILTRVDGCATLAAIVDDLAVAYAAPRAQIDTDVRRFLDALRAKVWLGLAT